MTREDEIERVLDEGHSRRVSCTTDHKALIRRGDVL
jgi:hypothetical protein